MIVGRRPRLTEAQRARVQELRAIVFDARREMKEIAALAGTSSKAAQACAKKTVKRYDRPNRFTAERSPNSHRKQR